ncbi:MAG: carboxypeptidase-like regulatory domain-containing protein, partial [Bacteroidota bacterium]
MRSLLLLLVPLAIVLAAPAQAQTVVTGTILDDGGEPLPYATILVAGTTDGTATGGDGRFSFTTTAEGRRQLVARYVGYAPATRRVTLAGDTVRVSIQLRESLLNLDGAVVTADALAG